MFMAKFALGHHREFTEAGCVRAVLAEAVLTFLFVFSGVGSAMAAGTCVMYSVTWKRCVHACMCSIEGESSTYDLSCMQGGWREAPTRSWA
jgi:hypothetical protein